jgi:hypothetical protein
MFKLATITLMIFLILPASAMESVKGAKKDLEKFKQEMSLEFRQIENDLKLMTEKAEKKTDAAYRNSVKELTDARNKLRSDLDNLEADAKGEWKEAKNSISTSMEKLHTKIQQGLKK